MGFFDHEKNVKEYLKIAEGYDGKELIEILKPYLKTDATILELGMGPGKDLDILKKDFQVTGSDNSKIFLDMYRRNNPDAELLQLDAVTLGINKRFDCIYSNKVLMHLKREELKKSFQRQKEILKKDGLLFHSFWYGDKEELLEDLRFVYYNKQTIQHVIGDSFRLIEFKRYKEIEKDDSFYIILKNEE